jgi:hypothetical protein
MSILDDAIREHLELKRAHGADEAEVKRLEDEAFGPPGRPEEPDPLAEAPTEFMATPEAAEATEGTEGSRRRVNIADLQEPPEPSEPEEEPRVEPAETVEPEEEAAPVAPAEDPAQAAPPAEEEAPALEHEIVPEAEAPKEPEPVADAGPGTEERHAIAEQPTEFFDIESEMGTEDAPALPAEAPSPSDEEIIEAEAAEPRLVPVADDEEEDEDFWSDQRLSDELDQALEAPLVEEKPPEEESAEEDEQPRTDYDPDTGHEDVLEDTPEFLEDAPEDDNLWFEQRPPKDFDFDD